MTENRKLIDQTAATRDAKIDADPMAAAIEAAKAFKWPADMAGELDAWECFDRYGANFCQDAEQGRSVALYPVENAKTRTKKPFVVVEFRDGEWAPDWRTELRASQRRLKACLAAHAETITEFDALVAKHDARWMALNDRETGHTREAEAVASAFNARDEIDFLPESPETARTKAIELAAERAEIESNVIDDNAPDKWAVVYLREFQRDGKRERVSDVFGIGEQMTDAFAAAQTYGFGGDWNRIEVLSGPGEIDAAFTRAPSGSFDGMSRIEAFFFVPVSNVEAVCLDQARSHSGNDPVKSVMDEIRAKAEAREAIPNITAAELEAQTRRVEATTSWRVDAQEALGKEPGDFGDRLAANAQRAEQEADGGATSYKELRSLHSACASRAMPAGETEARLTTTSHTDGWKDSMKVEVEPVMWPAEIDEAIDRLVAVLMLETSNGAAECAAHDLIKKKHDTAALASSVVFALCLTAVQDRPAIERGAMALIHALAQSVRR